MVKLIFAVHDDTMVIYDSIIITEKLKLIGLILWMGSTGKSKNTPCSYVTSPPEGGISPNIVEETK